MPATKRLTLYNSVDSPYPHRVRLALEETGAKYDIIWINLLSKPEWYKKVYSQAKVPFLVYGGPALHEGEVPSPEAETISESMVILEFLVDLFPETHLLPTDPVQRAKARFFIKTTEERFCKVFFSFIFLGGGVDSMLAAVEEMQALLPDADFAVGRWSIADAAFVPFLLRLDRSLKNNVGVFAEGVVKETLDALYEPKFARIRRYLEDNLARDSMIETWNEPSVMAQMGRRLDRMRRTGVINADLSVPVPKQQ